MLEDVWHGVRDGHVMNHWGPLHCCYVKDTHSIAKKTHETPVARGGHPQKSAVTNKVKAPVFWMKKRRSMGLPLDSREFTDEALAGGDG